MKRDGFIATSLLYSFFLIFITLFVVLITNYLHNRVLIQALNNSAWETLLGINNTKISDMNVGDKVNFDFNDTNNIVMNDHSGWIVAYIETNGNEKTYYFLSDLNAQKLGVYYKIKDVDKFAKVHAITVDVFNKLVEEHLYENAFDRTGFTVSLPDSKTLSKVRTQNISTNILNNIFGVNGDYIVLYNSGSANGYLDSTYYKYKNYNLANAGSNGVANAALVSNYCGATFDGTKITYSSTNTFGYANVVPASATNETYTDYCYYSSPVDYSHYTTDMVTGFDDITTEGVGDRVLTTYSSVYTLRLMAKVTVNVNDTDTYIAGGKGTSLDPYIFTNGVKQ